MKLIMENWKRFLSESISTSTQQPEKFTGIIQVVPTDLSALKDLQQKIMQKYPDQKPIDKLHVTLLHQMVPKNVTSSNGLRGDKALKAFFKSPEAQSLQPPEIQFGEVGIKTGEGQTSTFIKVLNPDALQNYLQSVIKGAGLNPNEVAEASAAEPREAGRIFHISLTNLTGNPGDSFAHIGGGETIEV